MSDDESNEYWKELANKIRARTPQPAYYIVAFYADGGNGGPYPAKRTFTDLSVATQFLVAQRKAWDGAFKDLVTMWSANEPAEGDGLTFDEMRAKEAAWKQHREELRLRQQGWLEKLLIRLGLGWLL